MTTQQEPGTQSKDIPELVSPVREAKARATKIRGQLGRLAKLYEETAQTITLAYQNRDWLILGYPSWPEYCESELGTGIAKVRAEIRKAWEPVFSEAGMKTGEIAAVCGTDRKTIQRDTATNVPPADGTNVPPSPDQPEYHTPVLQGEVHTHAYKDNKIRVPVGGECVCDDIMFASEEEIDDLVEAISPYLDVTMTEYLIEKLSVNR